MEIKGHKEEIRMEWMNKLMGGWGSGQRIEKM